MCGTTASAVLTGPHSMVSTAEVKCQRSSAPKGPTWMIPATQTSTSIGPTSCSIRWIRSITAALSVTSQTYASTSYPSVLSRSAARCNSASVREQITSR